MEKNGAIEPDVPLDQVRATPYPLPREFEWSLERRNGFDVFNALNLMDNSLFTEDLKFGPGDGYLHFYLYNWRCRVIQSEKVGLVML